MHFDWGAAVTAIVTLLIFVLTNRLEVKKRHLQNMEKWQDLLTELNDYPPHEHMEHAGALTREGLRYRRGRRSTDG